MHGIRMPAYGREGTRGSEIAMRGQNQLGIEDTSPLGLCVARLRAFAFPPTHPGESPPTEYLEGVGCVVVGGCGSRFATVGRYRSAVTLPLPPCQRFDSISSTYQQGCTRESEYRLTQGPKARRTPRHGPKYSACNTGTVCPARMQCEQGELLDGVAR